MDSIMDTIKKRISIRAYQDRALEKNTIDSLLEAAREAPSARNLQQLEYKVITSKALSQKMSDTVEAEVKKEIASMPPGSPAAPVKPHYFYNAPLVIIITGPVDNIWTATDAALAAQNIMLYAASINLGTCFIGMSRLLEKNPAMLQELHIGNGRKIAACVGCGYPDEQPAPKKKNLSAEYFT